MAFSTVSGMPPTLWSSAVQLAWQPILTFNTRRIALLEWFEANADVASFHDHEDHVGVSIGDRRTRLIVERDGLTITLAGPDAQFATLAPSVQGAIDVMEPSAVRLASHVNAVSGPISLEYPEACLSLSGRASGISSEHFRAVDAAILFDLESDRADGQAEFGVVSSGELADRLTRKYEPRVAGRTPTVGLGESDRGDLPPVNIYAEILWRRWKGPMEASADAVLDIAGQLNADSLVLAESLIAGLE